MTLTLSSTATGLTGGDFALVYAHIEAFTGYDTTTPVGTKGHLDNGIVTIGNKNNPITMTLPSAPASTSYVVGSLFGGPYNGASAMTPGSGFTEVYDFTGADVNGLNFETEHITGTTSTSVTWADPNTSGGFSTDGFWASSAMALEVRVAGSGSSGSLTQAAGTGVARALTPEVDKTLSQASGTGVANALGPQDAGSINQAAGTGVARALTPEVDKPLGQASGTGQAGTFSFGTAGSGTLGQAAGIGVARGIAAEVDKALSQAAGIGVAGSLTPTDQLGITQASGTGVARGLTPEVDKPLSQAAGIGVAGAFVAQVTITLTGAVGIGVAGSMLGGPGGVLSGASGTGVAHTISVEVDAFLGQASGVGTAGNVNGSGGSFGSLTGASGTGVAGSIGPSVAAFLAQAAGVGVAGAVGPSPAGALTGASGTGVAHTISAEVDAFLGGATGTGQAGQIGGSIPGNGSINQAAGTGVARTLTPQVTVGVGQAAGAGIAGTISGQASGGTIQVGIQGVAAIGIAGIITVSGTVQPVTGGGNGGARPIAVEPERRKKKKVKPTIFEPIKRKGFEIANPKPRPVVEEPELEPELLDFRDQIELAVEEAIEQAAPKDDPRIAELLRENAELREKIAALMAQRKPDEPQAMPIEQPSAPPDQPQPAPAVVAQEEDDGTEHIINEHLKNEQAARDAIAAMLSDILKSIDKQTA